MGRRAGTVPAACFRLRLSVGLLQSSFTSCSLINKWRPTILGWLRWVRGRSSLSSLHCSVSVTHVASGSQTHDEMRCDAVSVSSCFSCLHATCSWYLFHLHTRLNLNFFPLQKGVWRLKGALALIFVDERLCARLTANGHASP